MRICLVSCEYPPFGGGGIGTYTWNASRFLAAAGHDVHVICNAWPDYIAKNPRFALEIDSIQNLTVHRVDAITDKYGPRPPYDADDSPLGKVCRWWDSSLFWSTLAAEELTKVVRDYDVEVVEYPECYAEAYTAMRWRTQGIRGVDVPMTITLHSPIHEVTEYNLYRMYEAWFRRRDSAEEYCIRHANMLASPSAALVDVVFDRMKLDPEQNPCEVIHNPMDFDSLPEISPEERAQEEDMTLLFAGRIEPRKGIKYLVDAASLLMDKYPKLSVHFIGKDCDAGEVPGSTVDFMQQRIPERFKSRFVFEGLKPRAEVLKRYGTATASIVPPPWDNFPYTCCEAMAYNACVIASNRGGMAEMIEHEKSGLLFPTMNVPALAAAIERVLNDKELRERCKANAGPRIRQVCDPDLFVRKRIAHYERTIARHQAGKRRVWISKPARRERVAVFLPNHSGVPDQLTTIASLEKAAARAEMDLSVSVVGTRRYFDMKEGQVPPGVHLLNSGQIPDESALATWVRALEEDSPAYLMTMWPSEELGEDYFVTCRNAMLRDHEVAWATTWMESIKVPSQEPYAGFDFSLPLELLFYHAVPFALLRYDLFKKVGGWNLELAAGYRQWDLWLALHRHGYKGIVVPEWQGKYVPWGQIKCTPPSHPKAYELVLEAITRRNADLFRANGPLMFIAQATNKQGC